MNWIDKVSGTIVGRLLVWPIVTLAMLFIGVVAFLACIAVAIIWPVTPKKDREWPFNADKHAPGNHTTTKGEV